MRQTPRRYSFKHESSSSQSSGSLNEVTHIGSKPQYRNKQNRPSSSKWEHEVCQSKKKNFVSPALANIGDLNHLLMPADPRQIPSGKSHLKAVWGLYDRSKMAHAPILVFATIFAPWLEHYGIQGEILITGNGPTKAWEENKLICNSGFMRTSKINSRISCTNDKHIYTGAKTLKEAFLIWS